MRIVLAIALAAFWYHLFAGIRHLAWDVGMGFEKRVARGSGYLVVALAAAAFAATAAPDARRPVFHGLAVSRQPGSASRHWRNQRMTSIALLPLGLWFLFALLGQPALDHAVVAGWFAKPLQALLGALFGAALLWHSMQGLQVVIEDYVGGTLRAFSIALARLLHVAAALALGAALAKLAIGGAA